MCSCVWDGLAVSLWRDNQMLGWTCSVPLERQPDVGVDLLCPFGEKTRCWGGLAVSLWRDNQMLGWTCCVPAKRQPSMVTKVSEALLNGEQTNLFPHCSSVQTVCFMEKKKIKEDCLTPGWKEKSRTKSHFWDKQWRVVSKLSGKSKTSARKYNSRWHCSWRVGDVGCRKCPGCKRMHLYSNWRNGSPFPSYFASHNNFRRLCFWCSDFLSPVKNLQASSGWGITSFPAARPKNSSISQTCVLCRCCISCMKEETTETNWDVPSLLSHPRRTLCIWDFRRFGLTGTWVFLSWILVSVELESNLNWEIFKHSSSQNKTKI